MTLCDPDQGRFQPKEVPHPFAWPQYNEKLPVKKIGSFDD